MKITDIMWKDRYIEKLSVKHGISISEVEEALQARPLIRKIAKGRVFGEDVYAAMAQIEQGRYIIVFFIKKKNAIILPISARDLDDSERKYYEKHKKY